MMKRLLLALGLLALPHVAAADVTINSLSAAGALGGTEAIPVFQTANPAVRTTPSALRVYIVGTASTWSALQTYQNSMFTMLGSSTGKTTFTSANAGASDFTLTIPANTGTIAELNLAQTFSAKQTFSGAIDMTGLSSGTQVSCMGLDSGNHLVLALAACGSGGGLTIGTTTITSGTTNRLLYDNGGVLGELILGATLANTAGTLDSKIVDTTHTTSAAVANVGGQDDYNGSSITGTLATLASGQSQMVTNQNASTLTINNNSQTVNGLPLSTSLHTGGFYGYAYNTTTSQISGFGFPGFGTITSGALMKFTDGTGAATAGDLSGDCATSGSLVVTCVKGSSAAFGIVKVDNVTITESGGVISAVGGAATTITPGTTTIAGATAPCTIRNTASTTMGCTAETGTGSPVLSASPALTGTPTAPTATVGTNTTQLATTAFVIANATALSCDTGFTAVLGQCVWTISANNTSPFITFTGLSKDRYTFSCSGIQAGNTTSVIEVQFGEGGVSWHTGGSDYAFSGLYTVSNTSVFNANNGPANGVPIAYQPTVSGNNLLSLNMEVMGFSGGGNKAFAVTTNFLNQTPAQQSYWINGKDVHNTAALTTWRVGDTQGTPANLVAGSCTARQNG